MIITITTDNKIIKTASNSLKVQSRKGKGVKNKSQQSILTALSTNTLDSILLFTSKGRMFRSEVDKIPETVDINSLIKLNTNEKIIAATPTSENNENNKYAVFITKQGYIKKTALEEYRSSRKNSGIIAIKFKEGDSLANVYFMNDEDLLLLTKEGYIIHFETKDIKPIGRVTAGVKGIKLSTENDEVVAGLPIYSKDNLLITFDKDGVVKKTVIEEYPLQNRDGKGLKYNSKELVCAVLAAETDKLLITGDKRSMCINVEDLPLCKRTTLGTKVIKDGTIETATTVQ